jgi:hypothetical protein
LFFLRQTFRGQTPLHLVTARLVAELTKTEPLLLRLKPSTYALSEYFPELAAQHKQHQTQTMILNLQKEQLLMQQN